MAGVIATAGTGGAAPHAERGTRRRVKGLGPGMATVTEAMNETTDAAPQTATGLVVMG